MYITFGEGKINNFKVEIIYLMVYTNDEFVVTYSNIKV